MRARAVLPPLICCCPQDYKRRQREAEQQMDPLASALSQPASASLPPASTLPGGVQMQRSLPAKV